MSSQPLSRLLLLAAIGVAILGCAGAVRVARVSDQPATVEITNASGTLQVANSRSGQAIFQAAGLAPGRSVTGTVQLSNTGTLAGDLSLAQLDVQNQPGPNGGLLSNAVQLAVQDITGGSSIPVFSGSLGGVGTRPLGSIAAGEARTYRFTASLPNTGTPPGPTAGDNAYEGSRVSVRYVWTATAPDETGGGNGGRGGGNGGGGGNGNGGGNGTTPVQPKFSFRVVPGALLKRGWIDVLVECERACGLDAWAQVSKIRRAKFAHRRVQAPLPGETARIRLKLSSKGKRALRSALRRRPRATVRVYLRVVPAADNTRTYSKNVVVKRPRPKRR